MKRRLGGLIASFVLATFGTVALVAYVQSAKSKATAGEELVDVLVVSQAIAKGTPAGDIEGLVKPTKVPVKLKAEGSLDSLKPLKGLVAGVNLVPGEQLMAARFVTPQAAAQKVEIPPGLLQVTVSLDSQRAVGGQVRVGDTVGVVASLKKDGNETTHQILHKVLVTSVQVEKAPPKEPKEGDKNKDDRAPTLAPTGNLLVTLALDAASVERVVFAAEYGTLWLTAQPAEASEGGTKIVTSGNVY